MNAAVIGSGGREHAISLSLASAPSLDKLYIIPGNPGTEEIGINSDIPVKPGNELLAFLREKQVELVIIGPEQPLVDGLADFLISAGIYVFGPKAAAARIEGDKAFSKELMKKYNVPTAAFEVFSKEQKNEALEYISKSSLPIVIKANGLAAGKGVLICLTPEEAFEAIEECFTNKTFGSAGDTVVIEEFMEGEEASVFAITDGTDFICLPSAQDHKRVFDNDSGKNTGGMGAYSPAPVVTQSVLKETEEKIIIPILKAMREEGHPFTGCLYCGLMITAQGPKVVEFNCRFGDPETQVVLPLMKGDMLKLFYSAAAGKIDKDAVAYSGGSAVCVVAASGGYPGEFKKGYEITGLSEKLPLGGIIYHSGTKKDDNKIVTNGGRVLGITAITEDNNIPGCKEKAYNILKKISFADMHFRRDISDKALKYLE